MSTSSVGGSGFIRGGLSTGIPAKIGPKDDSKKPITTVATKVLKETTEKTGNSLTRTKVSKSNGTTNPTTRKTNETAEKVGVTGSKGASVDTPSTNEVLKAPSTKELLQALSVDTTSIGMVNGKTIGPDTQFSDRGTIEFGMFTIRYAPIKEIERELLLTELYTKAGFSPEPKRLLNPTESLSLRDHFKSKDATFPGSLGMMIMPTFKGMSGKDLFSLPHVMEKYTSCFEKNLSVIAKLIILNSVLGNNQLMGDHGENVMYEIRSLESPEDEFNVQPSFGNPDNSNDPLKEVILKFESNMADGSELPTEWLNQLTTTANKIIQVVGLDLLAAKASPNASKTSESRNERMEAVESSVLTNFQSVLRRTDKELRHISAQGPAHDRSLLTVLGLKALNEGVITAYQATEAMIPALEEEINTTINKANNPIHKFSPVEIEKLGEKINGMKSLLKNLHNFKNAQRSGRLSEEVERLANKFSVVNK